MSNFDRTINTQLMDLLKIEATKVGWWADVLADPTLFIATRGSYVDVYWRGQRIFHACASASGLEVSTHEKYLLDPDLSDQVFLENGQFKTEALVAKGFLKTYLPNETLKKIKRAAGLFSGFEKTGCHEVAVGASAVIDCEITLPGVVSLDDGGRDKTAPRIDLAIIEKSGDDARLVFWEAKHFVNGELRAAGSQQAAVVRQIKIYRKWLADPEQAEAIRRSYQAVASNLVEIDEMRPIPRLSSLIAEVGRGKRRVTLGSEPKVGLIIFGFDFGQKDESRWKKHLKDLKDEIGEKLVIAKGDPKKFKL